MDDIPESVPTMDEAKSMMKDIECILKTGGFSMKEWLVSGNRQENSEISLDQKAVQFLTGNIVTQI